MTAADSTAKKFYTYAHYRSDNLNAGPFYIGKGRASRAWKTVGKGRSSFWQRTVAKHGLHVEIIAEWPTEQEALDHEMLLISCFRSMGVKLTNLTDGGDGMRNPHPDVRSKIASAAKKQWQDPHQRALLIERQSSEEARRKKSESLRRAFARPESRAKRAASAERLWEDQQHKAMMLSIWNSREHKEKMSASLKAARQRPEVKAKHDAANVQKRAETSARKSAQPKPVKMTKREASMLAAKVRHEKMLQRHASLPPEERERLLKDAARAREKQARLKTAPSHPQLEQQIQSPASVLPPGTTHQ